MTYERKLRLAIAGVAVAVGLFAASPASAATTRTVNDDGVTGCPAATFATIQAAVTASADGDTIVVCPGTYPEQVNVNKQVTIRGAQAGVDARTPRAGAESILQGEFALLANNITIDGFTVTLGASAHDAGIYFPNNQSGQKVINNIITGNTTGIELANDWFTLTPHQSVIRHNLIDSNNAPGPTTGNGIYGDQGIQSVAIDENRFTDNDVASIQLQTSRIGNSQLVRPVNDVRITGNEMDKQIRITQGRDIVISGNTLAIVPGGIASPQNGIQLDSNNRRVTISGNTITGATDPGTGAISFTNLDYALLGLNTSVPTEDVTITSNTLVDNDTAVLVGDSGGTPAYVGLLHAHFNRIAGNDTGVELNSNAEVNAANNWWGCNGGPADPACDSVEGDFVDQIDYTPWLVLRISASPSTIYEGTGQSQIVADLTRNSDGVNVGPGFPNDTPIDFGTNLGTVNPLTGFTDNGSAGTRLSAPPAGTGTATVTGTLDNQSVDTQVAIVPVLPPAAAAQLVASAKRECHTKVATIVGTEGPDLIVGTPGRDVIQAGGGDDRIYGQSGADLICGGGGNDRLFGNGGADRLLGGRGVDFLRGGPGDDRTFGGSPVTPGAGHGGS
jgi:hemolysin type calcium-binding protein/parallel beta helix pectate lyase-like protein